MKICYCLLNYQQQLSAAAGPWQHACGDSMTKTQKRLFNSIVFFLAVFALQTAHAEQVLITSTATDMLVVQFPEVDREVLIEQLGVLRSQLIKRKQALLQNVADKKLDGKDAVITAIMPGGLLYAGYKKVRYEQAKNELDRVSTDIEEYSGDLVAMQSRAAPVAVAWLP